MEREEKERGPGAEKVAVVAMQCCVVVFLTCVDYSFFVFFLNSKKRMRMSTGMD